jgi:hypothetical protein
MGRVTSQPRRGSPRWPLAISVLAAALALIVGSQPVAHLTHFAGVRHVVCEHGELIHLGDDEGAAAEPQSAPQSGVSARSGGGARSGHNHCAFAAREPTVHASLTPPAGTSFVGPIEKTMLPVVVVADRRAVWRFAPKTSPPALA